MKCHYGYTTSSDTYTGSTTLSITPIKRQHTFWLFNSARYVEVLESEVLALANIVAMVNLLGLPYWEQLQNQVLYDDIPHMLCMNINTDIQQWTRDLKINTVIEETIS